ncbi:MAG: hypothetical protein JWR04_3195 [Rhodoglobus sp.]|nr:hypothetical protein [Rhodoglobus sp.]
MTSDDGASTPARGPLDREYPSDRAARPLAGTTNSRRSYIALWILDLLALATGTVLVLSQGASGLALATLATGIVTLLAILFLNSFTGGPLFIRGRGERERGEQD